MSQPAPNVFLLTFARRGEEPAIRDALAALQERYPAARIQAVGTPVSEPALRALGLSQVLIYTRGKPVRHVLEEAQLTMPEAAAIVYGGDDLRGHLKLEALAYAIGVRRVLRCRRGRPPVPVGRVRLAFIVARKALSLVARVAVATGVAAVACAVLCRSRRRGGGPS